MIERKTMAVPVEPTDADLQAVSGKQWNVVTSGETYPNVRGIWRAIAAIYADGSATASPRMTQAPDTGLRDARVKPLEWTHQPQSHMARVIAGWFYDAEVLWVEGRSKPEMTVLTGPTIGRKQFATLTEAKAAAQADYERRILSALAPSEALEQAREALAWRTMDSAPKDGKHCILAVQHGCFIYSVQGCFDGRVWRHVLDTDAQPLAWMPNVLLPEELRPPEFRSPVLSSLPPSPETEGK